MKLAKILLHYTTMIAAAVAGAATWFLAQDAAQQQRILDAVRTLDWAALAVPASGLVLFLWAKLAPQEWVDRIGAPPKTTPKEPTE